MGQSLCHGIKKDILNRAPHYISDWKDAFNSKVLSSTFFLFFTNMAPAVTFSLYFLDATDHNIGAIEVLFSSAMTGIFWSFFSGQPLVIVGVTGPIAILTGSIFAMSKSMGINFLPFYAWSQIWAGIMHIILASFNACDLINYLSRFSCEIFGILIAVIYIYNGISGIVKSFMHALSFSSSLVEFIIAIGVAWSSYFLYSARDWKIFNQKFRNLLCDYGPTFCVLIWSALPAILYLHPKTELPFLYMPTTFSPSVNRSWLVNIGDISGLGILLSIIPGIIITILFYFDHNVSSIMTQSPELKLRKGTAFNLDFFVLGIGVIITGILGLPPTNGLIPQSPLHSRSLAVYDRITHVHDGTETHDHDNNVLVVTKVHEQRLSNFGQAFLGGLVCFAPFSIALGDIPESALHGLFLFMGYTGFFDNEFSYRLYLFFKDSTLRSSTEFAWEKVLMFEWIAKFTTVQALLCGIIFAITFTPLAVIFPILIGGLVLVRIYLLPQYFPSDVLHAMDPLTVEAIEEDNEDDNNVELIYVPQDVPIHGEIEVVDFEGAKNC